MANSNKELILYEIFEGSVRSHDYGAFISNTLKKIIKNDYNFKECILTWIMSQPIVQKF